jgi:hypothetical protein
MAHVRADRILETTTTTGTGAITVAGAVAGYSTLDSRLSTSDTFDYVIFAVDGGGVPTGAWETGVGTYTGTDEFSRSVRQSSNSDALVDFAAGTKHVAMTLTASELASIIAAAAAGAEVITVSGTSADLLASDQGKYQRWTATSAKALTVRPESTHALPANGEWHIRNAAAENLTLVEGSGVVINPPNGGTLVIPPGGAATLKRATTDVFDLMGQVVAA